MRRILEYEEFASKEWIRKKIQDVIRNKDISGLRNLSFFGDFVAPEKALKFSKTRSGIEIIKEFIHGFDDPDEIVHLIEELEEYRLSNFLRGNTSLLIDYVITIGESKIIPDSFKWESVKP